MKSLTVVAVLLLALPGCRASAPVRPFPAMLDECRAYQSRDQVEAFVVAATDVIVVRLDLRGPGRSAVLHHGAGAARAVLPKGPASPPDASVVAHPLQSGRIDCDGLPAAGSFVRGREVTLSLTDLDFGDGGCWSLASLRLRIEAYPP